MALRKASSYSRKKARPYTRNSKSKAKAYIKTVPIVKIAKYTSGSARDFEENKHPYVVKLMSDEAIQIRDNALEAARMYLVKMMDRGALGQYFLSVKVHPHHMLRENKTAAGAGADRLSSGMKHSYGIVIGRAAMVKSNQEVFFISCANEKSARIARDALQDIKAKLPCRAKISFEKVA